MLQLLVVAALGLICALILWDMLREEFCQGCMVQGDVSRCGDCGEKFCRNCLGQRRTCLWCHEEER